jgi:hypothetical protein
LTANDNIFDGSFLYRTFFSLLLGTFFRPTYTRCMQM